MSQYLCKVLCVLILSYCKISHAGEGKLIATAGLTQIEDTGGGGIVPWATLSGYDTNKEYSINANVTNVTLDDYKLNAFSASLSIFDQLEVSVAKHKFELSTLGGSIAQHIVGLKYKVMGDALYGKWPQISVGILHKSLQDTAIAQALGANKTSGNDYYVAATRIHLGAVAGLNAVWNVSARATQANEMGLLGFSSRHQQNYKVMLEASAGVLLSQNIVIGPEFRQKPDLLGLGESHWRDYFISYMPSKSLSLTSAWADLGSIAGADKQQGIYFSINGHWL